MKILIINGPNLNMLGLREEVHYGSNTYSDLENLIATYASENNLQVTMIQSNYEGELVTIIQENYKQYDAYIINAAAYTHTSIAILDALLAVKVPTVEVHISDVDNREDFRKVNYIREACIHSISNEGINGYITALQYLGDKIEG